MAFYLARRDGWGTDSDGAIHPPPFTGDVPSGEASAAGEGRGTHFKGLLDVYGNERG